jgi:hypothetical protein
MSPIQQALTPYRFVAATALIAACSGAQGEPTIQMEAGTVGGQHDSGSLESDAAAPTRTCPVDTLMIEQPTQGSNERLCPFDRAAAKVRDILADAQSGECHADADCVVVNPVPTCATICPPAVPKASAASVAAAFACEVEQPICASFDPAACIGRSVPQCQAVHAKCSDSRCTTEPVLD